MNNRAVFLLMRCAAVLMTSTIGPTAWGHEQFPDGAHTATRSAGVHGGAGAAVSLADLQATVEALTRARSSTEKYQDVRAAKLDGYRAFGPYVRGMGFHYVDPRAARGPFDIERPPILLYEKDESAPEGLRLVGVSYLLAAPAGPNGQPIDAPFPQALAVWHKHNDICLFADRSVRLNASGADCEQRGGRFIAETDWMVHAWIWKDSPAGIFSPTNPDVQ
jgi:hypothetical protein